MVHFVVDIHSHILPEVDDGPKSWDVSVAMCRAAAADGITHMVATPHANDRYPYDREYLQGLLTRLQELVGDAPPEAAVGAQDELVSELDERQIARASCRETA